MRRLWLALVLVGCGGVESEVVDRVSFRDQSVPIASQVDVGLDQLVDGDYVVRRALPALPDVQSVRFRNGNLGRSLTFDAVGDCPPPDLCHQWMTSLRLTGTGPGRWRFDVGVDDLGMFSDQGIGEVWILWADADRRTLAIGTPDGSFGFILDRNPTGGEDRITAALDIMAWMGYRTDEMEGL